MPFAAAWMDLGIITISEVSQTEKDKYHMIWLKWQMACCCCWITGCLVIFPPLCLGLNMEFCDSNVIDHFLCDASPMMKISCSDTWFIEQRVVTLAVLTKIGMFLSYIYIIKTIIKFHSAQQKMKAFSTCSSHMIVVSISYGSCIFIYVKPSAKDEVTINKCVLLLTISIAPMLNTFIYSLRNKQV